jgi:prolyl-tRNA editing enzyme YbaK/EbsC (Cys-tRNA(Pro) deacylase)
VRLHRLSVPTPTVESAAAALGVDPAAIVKTLVTETRDGRIILAIAAGVARVDVKKVAVAAGLAGAAARLRMVPPERVLAAVGFGAGAVPPLAHDPRPLAVILDRGVLARGRVYGGGGAIDAMLEVEARDIARLTRAVEAEIIASSVT